ncbi:integral membrane protein [Hirsutella rhossiliensis]|uniref:Integral membrane protein n=1 Tax=Hirsutella rhossiliensis TaxID=111463 RepID=A0A9P8MN71_9HYPO|nr:uncharacterized protein HRG_10799 [Hirsutella rhossiliensis]KAH0958104.1 integral membrane protein [Hirsutella rhossiliensis]
MNSATAYRRSTIAPPVFRRPDLEDGTGARRRTFNPVDWPAFKENCDLERASSAEAVPYDPDWDNDGPGSAEPDNIGFAEGLRRILSVYPCRDAQWVVAVLFIVGSTSFTASSFFALMPLVFPETAFPGEMEVAFPTTITIGAGMFFLGGNLATIASFNVNRGPVSDDDALDGEKGYAPPPRYNPALLGSKEWVWFPSGAEFRAVFLPNPAFRAGLVSMSGGLILTTAAVGGNPVLLGSPEDPAFPDRLRNFVLIPLTVGGALLAAGGLALTMLAQERWYKPAVMSVAWHASFWNMLGALSLSLASLYNIVVPEDMLSPAVVNFVGTWLFFLAAYLQWHMVMVFYPRRVK